MATKTTQGDQPAKAAAERRGPIYFADGVAGFVSVEKSLMSLGFPYFDPKSVVIQLPASDVPIGLWDVDAMENTRTSAMEISGRFNLHEAPLINIGDLRDKLRSIAAAGEIAEFENEVPGYLGPHGPLIIDDAVKSAGTPEAFMERLKAEFS